MNKRRKFLILIAFLVIMSTPFIVEASKTPEKEDYVLKLSAVDSGAQTSPVPVNLLSNPSFEQGADCPTYWITTTQNPCDPVTFAWLSSGAHSGIHCVSVTICANAAGDSTYRCGVWETPQYSLSPFVAGNTYTFNAWVKTCNCKAVIAVGMWSVSGSCWNWITTSADERFVSVSDWTCISITFTIPCNCNVLNFQLGVSSNNISPGACSGTAWFDDACVIQCYSQQGTSGELITFSAHLCRGDSSVCGATICFYSCDQCGNIIQELGTAVTGTNGIATFSWTLTHAGDYWFVARFTSKDGDEHDSHS